MREPLLPDRPAVPPWLRGRPIADVDRASRESHTAELLAAAERAANDGDERKRQECLELVVLLNAPVAEAIASRYRARGMESDDLTQVAYVGLVKASQGFVCGEGPSFLAYAVPTIAGEIKRHFRDFGWLVRPPRRVQELRSAAAATRSDLQQRKGRPPTSAELAELLGVAEQDLDEAVLADGCFTAMSIDAPLRPRSGALLADVLVDDRDSFAQVEAAEVLRVVLAGLGERDRQVLQLRYLSGWTQERIGREIGVSQMHVSRLLTRILQQLRSDIAGTSAHAYASAGIGGSGIVGSGMRGTPSAASPG